MNSRPQKQSMSELKFRRLMEHNQRLKEDLGRPRIRVSEASTRCVYLIRPSRSCSWTKYALLLQSDPLLQDNERSPRTLLPIIWHVLPGMCFFGVCALHLAAVVVRSLPLRTQRQHVSHVRAGLYSPSVYFDWTAPSCQVVSSQGLLIDIPLSSCPRSGDPSTRRKTHMHQMQRALANVC